MLLTTEQQKQESAARPFAVATLNQSSELDGLSAAGDCSIRRPLEPNIFYEPWMLSAALASLPSENVRIVVVRHGSDVTGIFPLQLEHRFRGLPLSALKSWRHPYCFLCTPLLSLRYADDTLRAFLDWVDSGGAPAHLVELELVAADGPFNALLTEELSRRRGWGMRVHRHERALFDAGTTEISISGRHLKELRRLKRRLSERGCCVNRMMEAGEPVGRWIEQFLHLEASGWKGREQTAIASHDASRDFFARAATIAASQGRLEMLSIELDGVPVAMKCNFLAGNTAFAFKIAYDERFSRYSPGVLLELFNISSFAERSSRTRVMDSCAMSDHFMIDRLWSGRRILGDYMIASRGPARVMVRHLHRYIAVRDFVKRLNRGRHGRVPEVQPHPRSRDVR